MRIYYGPRSFDNCIKFLKKLYNVTYVIKITTFVKKRALHTVLLIQTNNVQFNSLIQDFAGFESQYYPPARTILMYIYETMNVYLRLFETRCANYLCCRPFMR
jgi:hypothetical protein